MGVTLLFLGILVALIACLALEEKIHAKKSLIVGVFAAISLLLGAALHLLPFGSVNVGGHEIDMPVYIPAIDWNVIAIIFGSSLFVDVTSKSGLFTWIAVKLTKASGGDPVRLLVFYGLMTVVFSAVLNNVTAMIIVGSLTGVSLSRLGRENLLGSRTSRISSAAASNRASAGPAVARCSATTRSRSILSVSFRTTKPPRSRPIALTARTTAGVPPSGASQ